MKKRYYTSLLFLAVFSAGAQQIVPNGGFELWDSSTVIGATKIYNPQGWTSLNTRLAEGGQTFQPVERTSDAYNGLYALKITANPAMGNSMIGMVYTADESDKEKNGTFPVESKIASVKAYYKYQPSANDSATIAVLFYKDGVKIGSAYQSIKEATNIYKPFLLQLHYNPNVPDPDAAEVYIFAGGPANGTSQSVLIIDELNFTYEGSTGLNQISKLSNVAVYPNPASSFIRLDYPIEKGDLYEIRDVLGKVNAEGSLLNNEADISMLKEGVYYFTLKRNEDVVITKFIKH